MGSEPDMGKVLAVYAVMAVIGLGFFLVVQGFVCWLLSGWVKRIPPEHRKIEPGKVWLLMIPLFHLVWNFFVYPPIALSFDSYFKARGETVESPLKLAKMLCWVAAAGFIGGLIPCLGVIVGPLCGLGALVLLIMVLVKFNDLRNRIGAAPAAGAPPAQA